MRELLELMEEANRLEAIDRTSKIDRDYNVGFLAGATQAILWMRGRNGPVIAPPPSHVLKELQASKEG